MASVVKLFEKSFKVMTTQESRTVELKFRTVVFRLFK